MALSKKSVAKKSSHRLFIVSSGSMAMSSWTSPCQSYALHVLVLDKSMPELRSPCPVLDKSMPELRSSCSCVGQSKGTLHVLLGQSYVLLELRVLSMSCWTSPCQSYPLHVPVLDKSMLRGSVGQVHTRVWILATVRRRQYCQSN
jgi:hypothetical protein